VEHLFVERSKTNYILKLLEDTVAGNRTTEKEMYERDERRDGLWGWSEEMELEPESEGMDDELNMENGMDLEGVDAFIEKAKMRCWHGKGTIMYQTMNREGMEEKKGAHKKRRGS
jgi:hypothetical protein